MSRTTLSLSDISRRLRTTSLWIKLVVVSGAVTALVVAAAFLELRSRVESEVRRVFVSELAASQQSARALQDRERHLLLATSNLVSTSPTLRAALETRRVEANSGLPSRPDLLATIQRELERIYGDLDTDLLAVTDADGRVLAAVGRYGAPKRGEALLVLPVVKEALAANDMSVDSSFGVLTHGFAASAMPAMQVGCVAILLDGYPVGVLLLGERLDRGELRATPVDRAGIIVTVGDVVLTSTVPDVTVGQQWRGRGHAGRGTPSTVMRVGAEDYAVASLPLGLAETGQPATLHSVRSITATLDPVTNALGRSFLILGIFAVVLAGLGAAIVARTSLRPLARFVAFMRSGAESGAYAHFADRTLSVEVATLTGAYNRLMDSLSAQHVQLSHRTNELAASNETLLMEVGERERVQRALRESEDQLRQSQKLEALGTLAGGVAHDFNNMLAVIMGYADFAIEELPEGTIREDVRRILEAGTRASTLVRQLLAFSRKQVLQPQVVDLNQIVAGLESMLRRLIGADVDLRIRPARQLACILADPGQIEQVLMNLVVNARDAMPTGGTLTIETANVFLEDRSGEDPDSIAGGPAAMLCVSDTGCGMDEATRRRIFEPFFTTKSPDKGTGLGLATVYGIVRQSGGSINVLSEPGAGAAFRTYFPAVSGAAGNAGVTKQKSDVSVHAETILLAEDDANVRAISRRTLAGRGYRVLEAADGSAALALAKMHAGPIHLLLADVVMPRMSGPELARQLQPLRPDMRIIFVSGHSEEAIERHGMLAPGALFLQKPMLPDALARAVRDLLDDVPAGSRA